jgi:hypothetical protein
MTEKAPHPQSQCFRLSSLSIFQAAWAAPLFQPIDHFTRKDQTGLATQQFKQNRHSVTRFHLPFKDGFNAG